MAELTTELRDKLRIEFVEQGVEVLDLCAKYDIPRLDLGREVASGGWRKDREAFLVSTAVKKLGVEGHEAVADQMVQVGQNLLVELNRNDLLPEAIKKVRGRAEAYRTTVESLDRAVRLARDVRGKRLGQPSVTQEPEKTEIQYVVKVQKEAVAEAPVSETA